MIIRLTKDHKKPNGRVLKKGKIIETSKGHTYKDFEVLAEEGHLSSPQNKELSDKLKADKSVEKAIAKKESKKVLTTDKKIENNGSK